MHDHRFDTYCGLYCGACGLLLKTKKGERIEDDLKCGGCKSHLLSRYCEKCDIRDCASSREIEFCFLCDEYPCSKLLDFKEDTDPHHSVILKNLEDLQRVGLKTWLREQKVRWKCSNCGRSFGWYDGTCDNCGEELFDCRKEERCLN